MLERLIRRADIMIVNFPPPARERLKLRWEDIEPLNPRLVYCSLTGYGETGPDRDRPGFDVTAYFGRSGILDSARYEGGPPGLSLPAQGDRATAMTLVAAILLGLRHRDQTGKGCWVGTSLYANGAWANGTTLAGAAIGGKLVTREPPHKPKNALTNLYRTRDDRWLQLLMVRDDRLWPTFCQVIGRPELATDPRFTDREERRKRALELHAVIGPVFASKTYAEWEGVCSDHRHSLRRDRPRWPTWSTTSRPSMPASSPTRRTPRCRAPSTIPSAWASPSRVRPDRRPPSASTTRRSCANSPTAMPILRPCEKPGRSDSTQPPRRNRG